MQQRQHTRITGTGIALPARKVDAAEVAALLGTSESWVIRNAGVATRYYVDRETGAQLGATALRHALQDAGLEMEQLDLVISVGATYDQPVPGNAALLLREMNVQMPGPACWDVDATCLGFIAALEIVDAMIALGRYRNIAVVTTEISSKSLNIKEKESAALFGDASAAVIFSAAGSDESSRLLTSRLETYHEGAHLAVVKGGGNNIPARHATTQAADFTFYMNGRELLRLTNKTLRPFFERLFAGLNFSWPEVDCLIPHQASAMGLQMGERLLDLPAGTFYRSLHDYGNCIAASLPLSLHLAIHEGRIQRGDTVCLAGTGAGFALGGAVFIY